MINARTPAAPVQGKPNWYTLFNPEECETCEGPVREPNDLLVRLFEEHLPYVQVVERVPAEQYYCDETDMGICDNCLRG